MSALEATLAISRYGLGARPGELRRAQADPRGWLREQIATAPPLPEAIAKLPSSVEIFGRFTAAQEARRDAKANRDAAADESEAANAQRIVQGVREVLGPVYAAQVLARYQVAAATEQPYRERLVHFWANHFAVSADKVAVLGLAAALENEAIRPHLGGRFADMLLAVESHPAMILYLDNQQSSGPNSQLARLAARRANSERKVGSNENLAREILELHTLGVHGGYTQADVTTFATALTGWSVGGGRGRRAAGEPGKFFFRTALHEPGAKTVVGKRYTSEGEAQAREILEDLAKHPATATFIATKLVRHFVSDQPPADAVDKIARAFRDSDGHLPTVHQAVIELAQVWQTPFAKFRTPHEFVIATFRALDFQPQQPRQVLSAFVALGQRPYTPGSPAGWPDIASEWDGPDALMKRIEWSSAVAQRVGLRIEPNGLAEEVLGDRLSDHTRTAIARAASGAQALTLLLMSPEFQQR